MNDDQLLRYSRQILLPKVGTEGQQRLIESHVLIIGMGGLGSPVAIYLAAAGVGRITVVDFDTVELSNLQRQIAHSSGDIGRPKVESGRERMLALNPLIEVRAIHRRLEGEELERHVAEADVVVEGSDNFATRFAVNEACVRTATPLVSGAAIRMEGQVSVFRPDRPDGPCYRCLYGGEGELDETCSQNGILAPVVGIIGCIQATETLKVLMDLGEPLEGRLLLMDAMGMHFREMKLKKDPKCPVCSQ
jgi:adenylyltransferase/sulfurtransferase